MEKINLADYTYTLPKERIATYGLAQRDQAKLLFYNGTIQHQKFFEITALLPKESTLFFNDTKVIQARLILKRDTGALIEVFLLNPVKSNEEIFTTLESREPVLYHCLIGNLKKWREGEVLTENLTFNEAKYTLSAKLISKADRFVEFSWDNPQMTFSDILETIGHTPLPPYIERPDEDQDKERYQTVYSTKPGAVAAPTAGLHFTEKVLEELTNKQLKTSYLTLHVSAGTFQPIKVDEITDHPMHQEQVILSQENLSTVIKSKKVIPVGTTAMRTLESTYWFGVKLLKTSDSIFHIPKLYPYRDWQELPDRHTAFAAVLDYMQGKGLKQLRGETEIFIFPGYEFRVCDGLITNFHQPGSTLILLVAALVGPAWKDIYDAALENDYRFLSYGDSSLLLR